MEGANEGTSYHTSTANPCPSSTEQNASVRPLEDGKRRAVKPSLRDLPTSDRYFWKHEVSEQLTQTAYDRYPDQLERPLPMSEITAMALNEACAFHGHGFFLHLPPRDSWRRAPKVDWCPMSRARPWPGARYCNLMYVDFDWSDLARENFSQSSHRSRYLNCDGQLNRPDDETPIYAIQCLSHKKAASYATDPPSLVLLANRSTFYLASTEDMQRAVGRWPKSKRQPKGPDPELRFNTTPYIWETLEQKEVNPLRAFQVGDIQALYWNIVRTCKEKTLPHTFLSKDLLAILPRPVCPEAGMPLGTQQLLRTRSDDGEVSAATSESSSTEEAEG